MISIKEYPYGKTGFLLAACDSDLLGKTFKDKKRGLKLEVRTGFYGGSTVTIDQFSEKLKKAAIANLVGEKTITKAVELGLVAESSILKIQNVSHVQIVKAL